MTGGPAFGASDRQHDLADVLAGLEPAVRIRGLGERKRRVHHHLDLAGGQQRPNLALQRLRAAGLARAHSFSWERTARETDAVIERLL